MIVKTLEYDLNILSRVYLMLGHLSNEFGDRLPEAFPGTHHQACLALEKILLLADYDLALIASSLRENK